MELVSLDDDVEDFIYLTCKELVEPFKISTKVKDLSMFINTILECDSTIINNPNKPIILNISKDIFGFIIKYMDYILKDGDEGDRVLDNIKINTTYKDVLSEVDFTYMIPLLDDLMDPGKSFSCLNGSWADYEPVIDTLLDTAEYLDMIKLYNKLIGVLAIIINSNPNGLLK